ncbi:MAG: MotA/TolQ/ExbB proton channel family protein [Prevotella sp.]|jgi:biopolymer transport protein ExbB|nr:MotA/TolQ/ExbB proton channel family protein [Prevotella sp.]
MLLLCSMALFVPSLPAQNDTLAETAMTAADSLLMAGAPEELPSPEDLVGEDVMALRPGMAENTGLHDQLKTKFVEGSAGFMSLVALALILGLTLCIERIIYLTLAEVNAKKLLRDVEKKVEAGDMEGAKALCRDTRGPVASICYQGLLHADEDMASVERNIVNYGMVQSGNLEKGCSWIRLFIAMAPSLGFLGTVIGMVIAFDQIQEAGDISPTIVAEGMKVALITTIFGIIVALVLQVFYNFILSKIERLTSQMEESAITLLDILMKRKLRKVQ